MFINQLPNDIGSFVVIFTDFANHHFRKSFQKKHKNGTVWALTEEAILLDLERIAVNMQLTQQVDQLWHKNDNWIFKYDFREALSSKSPKNSGNRCICHLDSNNRQIKILIIYTKTDLPKNIDEQQYIENVMKSEFCECWENCR